MSDLQRRAWIENQEVDPILSLRGLATAWQGTPWAPNSAVMGMRGGVACHLLPRAILVGAGWLREDFPSPSGSPGDGRHGGDGSIAPWLDQCPQFEALSAGPRLLKSVILTGDILGMRLGKRGVVGHLGLYLGEGRFIHVLQHKHTKIDPISDPTWEKRLLRAWRPKPRIKL